MDSFEKGEIVVGYDTYCYRPTFFEVVSHTKSGSPRLKQLKIEIISKESDPTYSCTNIKPILKEYVSDEYTSRWSKKKGNFGVTINGERNSLHKFEPDRNYQCESYY
jgi:hypothetical protein